MKVQRLVLLVVGDEQPALDRISPFADGEGCERRVTLLVKGMEEGGRPVVRGLFWLLANSIVEGHVVIRLEAPITNKRMREYLGLAKSAKSLLCNEMRRILGVTAARHVRIWWTQAASGLWRGRVEEASPRFSTLLLTMLRRGFLDPKPLLHHRASRVKPLGYLPQGGTFVAQLTRLHALLVVNWFLQASEQKRRFVRKPVCAVETSNGLPQCLHRS